MKSFYGYPSRLKSSIPVWLIHAFRLGRSGFSIAAQRFTRASRTNRFLALSGCLSLTLLLVFTLVRPEHFGQAGQGWWQVVLLKTEEMKLNWAKDQSAEYTLRAPQQQWIPEAGVSISTPKDLGRTRVTLSQRSVTIDHRPSIRKVVGIHPEHDEELDAEMVFTYTDAELGDLDETQLILYSSTGRRANLAAPPQQCAGYSDEYYPCGRCSSFFVVDGRRYFDRAGPRLCDYRYRRLVALGQRLFSCSLDRLQRQRVSCQRGE